MTSLIIGASGQVGRAIFDRFQFVNLPVHGTYHSFRSEALSWMNVTVPASINDYFKNHDAPVNIFIPGALTNVDLCETNSEESSRTNVWGIKNVVDLAPPESKIIFFSTDFVFDGNKGLYSELDVPNPINEYGRQKFLMEHYIATHAKKFMIVRTNVVFGPDDQNKNFVSRLIKNLQKDKSVSIPKDEFGTPTYNPDLARAISNLVFSTDRNGVYHLSGSKLVSRYRLAIEVAEVFGLNTSLIKPVLSADLKRPAKRPLSVGLISKHTNIAMMDYRDGLLAMKENLLK